MVSLLNDPNCASPANVDAGVLYRNDPTAYEERVRAQVRASHVNIPSDLVLPLQGAIVVSYNVESDLIVQTSPVEEMDDDFWYDDDEEDEEEDDDDD